MPTSLGSFTEFRKRVKNAVTGSGIEVGIECK
jgi:hypothetical protein